GADVVALVKHAARSGWVLAANAESKGADSAAGPRFPFRVALVLRGASSKEMRPITSRVLGMLMGSGAQPRIERKEDRPMVIVPVQPPPGSTSDPKGWGWVWWPEKDDLVISPGIAVGAEAVLAALDGKTPSAAEHPLLKELFKPEGDFDPVCVAFLDPAHCPKIPTQPSNGLTSTVEWINKLGAAGVQRIDYRWGFDDDALMGVTRIVAPKPRKPLLAIFDQPGFDKSSLLAMPDGVESFVELAISPSQ